MPHALLVEDDASTLEALELLVQRHGFTTAGVQTVADARREIEERPPELAILDLDLPDGNGRELFEDLQTGLDAEIVCVTGHATVEIAVDALRSGALDFLTKPLDPQRLQQVLNNVRRTLELREEVSKLREELRRLGRFGEMIGSSRPMQQVFDLVGRVARTRSTVLLTGETGTGKDLVARTIHDLSPRAKGPYVAVNCGAIQPSLIESELFGHEAGSFTGAQKLRRGVFEQADGGTIFLDEVTEMPKDAQVKLLRVLESRQVQRVGGEKTIDVDVRLIAATNHDPEQRVREGEFREDLLYRLKVFPIYVPPLRDRGRDIELLATYFLDLYNEDAEVPLRFQPDTLDALRAHDWPGNVRELRNVVERACILAGDEPIGPEHVRIDDAHAHGSSLSSGEDVEVEVGTSIADAEKQLILATLERLQGDKRKAAEVLGISLKTLYNRLNSYGIKRGKVAPET